MCCHQLSSSEVNSPLVCGTQQGLFRSSKTTCWSPSSTDRTGTGYAADQLGTSMQQDVQRALSAAGVPPDHLSSPPVSPAADIPSLSVESAPHILYVSNLNPATTSARTHGPDHLCATALPPLSLLCSTSLDRRLFRLVLLALLCHFLLAHRITRCRGGRWRLLHVDIDLFMTVRGVARFACCRPGCAYGGSFPVIAWSAALERLEDEAPER
mmetsp:Transcript_21986/g.49604  ORF Transcript_21986/g.49604 Transcript_21986/m.49604 type:complete len:212 (-) Transcript_21986:136-771(-)